MKNMFKKISSLLMAAVLVMSLMPAAMAADPTMVIIGNDEPLNDGKDSVEWLNYDGYVPGDLFAEYKGVMPGDKLTDEIYIQNNWKSWDYIRLYMGGLLHDKEGNPISDKVLKELTADERRKQESELDYMHDFLAQLTLTVWDGEQKDEKIIYQGHPNSLSEGFEKENYYLGRIESGDTVKLIVELDVPVTLGNDYMNRIGEVDWVFTWSGNDYPSPPRDPEDPEEPEEPLEPVVPPPVEPGTPVEPPVEPEEPVNPDIPQTGDMTKIMPYILMLILGIVGLILPLFKKKKSQE